MSARGGWACPECRYPDNRSHESSCYKCDAPKPAPPRSSRPPPPPREAKVEDWWCRPCKNLNFGWRKRCQRCDELNPALAKAEEEKPTRDRGDDRDSLRDRDGERDKDKEKSKSKDREREREESERKRPRYEDEDRGRGRGRDGNDPDLKQRLDRELDTARDRR